MGTNFYLRLPVKERTVNKLKDLTAKLEDAKLYDYDIKEEMYEIISEYEDYEIHLGKRSCGWSFCWDANNLKYYLPTIQSINEWLDKGVIVDEYNEKFTKEQFWNDEIGDCLYTIEGRFDSHRTYRNTHPNENYYYNPVTSKEDEEKFKPYAKDGYVDCAATEFHTPEGLRFVTYTDFT